jgi:hypothetical protein
MPGRRPERAPDEVDESGHYFDGRFGAGKLRLGQQALMGIHLDLIQASLEKGEVPVSFVKLLVHNAPLGH